MRRLPSAKRRMRLRRLPSARMKSALRKISQASVIDGPRSLKPLCRTWVSAIPYLSGDGMKSSNSTRRTWQSSLILPTVGSAKNQGFLRQDDELARNHRCDIGQIAGRQKRGKRHRQQLADVFFAPRVSDDARRSTERKLALELAAAETVAFSSTTPTCIHRRGYACKHPARRSHRTRDDMQYSFPYT